MTIARFSKVASVVLLSAVCSTLSFAGVGSSNTATADPPVPHPSTHPCKVVLFQHDRFDDSTPELFLIRRLPLAPRPGPK